MFDRRFMAAILHPSSFCAPLPRPYIAIRARGPGRQAMTKMGKEGREEEGITDSGIELGYLEDIFNSSLWVSLVHSYFVSLHMQYLVTS